MVSQSKLGKTKEFISKDGSDWQLFTDKYSLGAKLYKNGYPQTDRPTDRPTDTPSYTDMRGGI